MEVWQTATVESERLHRWALGPLELLVRRVGDELHLAVERGEQMQVVPLEPRPADAPEPTAEPVDWTRWVVDPRGKAGDALSLEFQPVMPDRPVIARPESALRVPAGAAALFYVSIPVWVRLISQADRAMTLCEIPSMVLSNIWFGEPTAGELCYSLSTTARRRVDQSPSQPHRALCPLHLRNEAAEELHVQRIRVPVVNLTLFDDGDRMWTNRVDVVHQGGDAGSAIEVVPGPPEGAGAEAEAIGEAREMVRQRMWTRAFGAIGSMFS